MASHRRTRLKALLDERFLVIALVLVVLAAGGAWATYTTAAAPGTHVEQRTISSWQVAGEFNHSAAVVDATPIADRGTVRADRKFYFTNAMPVLDGRFAFGLDGDMRNATVTTRTTLVNYAVYTRGVQGQAGIGSRSGTRNRSATRLWEITTPLGTERERIEAGEAATTEFSIDVSDLRERIRSIDRALGPISEVTDARTTVAVSVTVDGTVGGERVRRSFNYTLPVNSSTGYYVVYPAEKPDATQFDVTRPVTVPNDYGTLTILASFAGLLVPLVLLTGLVYGRENDWFDASETARADAQRAKLRAAFEEWITTGSVATDDRTTVTVDSLEGLVDVAIDSDRRVIEDAETGTYVVIDDGVRYQFTPELAAPADTGATVRDQGRDDGVEPDASADESTETAAADHNQSNEGDGTDGNSQPTAVVELSGRTPDGEQGNGTGSESGNATGDRPTDSRGVIDRLQSAVGSVIGGSRSAEGSSEAADGDDDEPTLTDIRHVGEARAATLRDAGFRTVADVRSATPAELREVGDIGATRAEQIHDSAVEVADSGEDPESAPAGEQSASASAAEDRRRNSRD